MAGTWTNGFYDSKAWRACRDSFIATRISLDGGLCQKCRHQLGDIVHHVVHLTPENINDPMISLNHENLMYLCQRCHNEIHDSSGNNIGFDAEGNVIDLGRSD